MTNRKTLAEAKIIARSSDPAWLGEELFRLQEQAADRDDLRAALLALLDAVDYTRGACGIAEPISGVLPQVLIDNARKALAATP